MNPVTLLQNSSYCCVMTQNNILVCAMNGIGVKPLISTYTNYPQMMKGAVIADTVIGKAAAMIAVAGGAVAVHGQVMSQSGLDFLNQMGIPASYDELVPLILNRTRDGSCPIEACVKEIDTIPEAITAIRNTIAELMAKKD